MVGVFEADGMYFLSNGENAKGLFAGMGVIGEESMEATITPAKAEEEDAEDESDHCDTAYRTAGDGACALDETACVVEGVEENVLDGEILDKVVEEANELDDELDGELDDALASADEDGVLLVMNGAARTAFEERKPAVKSPTGQAPALHGLDLQHPMNGGDDVAQVYQRLPVGHC
ncbi:hypothetical protein MMC30_007802 [Trapelia coarctata]|nr:hypothetical protein [Trapelia coarctata]